MQRCPFGPRSGETQTVEFTKLNPRQKIPVLQDGDFTLAESAAIVTYLADTYGTSQHLAPQPQCKRERALYYQWCFFIMTELDAHTLYIIRKHADLKEIYGEAPNALRAAREGFLKQVGVAAQTLSSHGPFILGEAFTGADILLRNATSAVRREIPLTDVLRDYMKSEQLLVKPTNSRFKRTRYPERVRTITLVSGFGGRQTLFTYSQQTQ